MDRKEGRKSQSRNVPALSTVKSGYMNVSVKVINLEGRKGGNALFKDVLNTFNLRLYGDRHMVNDHSDSKRRNPLSPHELPFHINSNGSFICL